jgi:hypothetical protein
LQYTLNNYGNVCDLDNHDVVVGKLISLGIPVFVNKKDARQHAVNEKLTGFKYLKLTPSIISSGGFINLTDKRPFLLNK